MPQQPLPERVIAALREALSSKGDFFTFGASDMNTGLASAADAERGDAEPVLDVMAALSASPMFALALAEFDKALVAEECVLSLSNTSVDFALRHLCARCYLAGVRVASAAASDGGAK